MIYAYFLLLLKSKTRQTRHAYKAVGLRLERAILQTTGHNLSSWVLQPVGLPFLFVTEVMKYLPLLVFVVLLAITTLLNGLGSQDNIADSLAGGFGASLGSFAGTCFVSRVVRSLLKKRMDEEKKLVKWTLIASLALTYLFYGLVMSNSVHYIVGTLPWVLFWYFYDLHTAKIKESRA